MSLRPSLNSTDPLPAEAVGVDFRLTKLINSLFTSQRNQAAPQPHPQAFLRLAAGLLGVG
jgi:hypothetical protein